jgi:hypothetical protein
MHLEFIELTRDDDAALQEFYNIYATSFPLPDEQEPIEGFIDVLRMNADRDVQRNFGPYQEVLLAIRDPESRAIVGGLVFSVTFGQKHWDAGIAGSVQAIYLFLDRKFRERHRLDARAIVPEIERRALEICRPHAPATCMEIAIFFEVNNPRKMLAHQIKADYDMSGLDPYKRYKNWIGLKCRPLDFNYVQPPLNSEKKAVDYLDLFYYGPRERIPAAMLAEHLRAFISVSVLKGKDPRKDPDFLEMDSTLRATAHVRVIDPENDKKIRSILDQARLRMSGAPDTSFDPFGRPPAESIYRLPERRSLARLLAVAWNAVYRFIFYLFHVLEREHILVTYLEIVVGGLGLFVLFFGEEIIVGNLHLMETWKHYAEEFILLVLLLYVMCRGLVNMRRARLGNDFGRMWRRLHARSDPAAGRRSLNFDWFAREVKQRIPECQNFWRIADDTTSVDARGQATDAIREYSAQIHSDRVWNVTDAQRLKTELPELDTWLDDFADGLVGARFTNCPGRNFFSLIVPIATPAGRLGPLGLAGIEIDAALAKEITEQIPRRPHRSQRREQDAPCLLALRQVIIHNAAAASPVPGKLEIQFGLMLTTLMHLAVLLWKLAPGGDVANGLPQDLVILVVSGNRHGAAVLKELGFELALRAAPHEPEEGAESTEDLAQANLSVYRLTVGANTSAARRFRTLMSDAVQTLAMRTA